MAPPYLPTSGSPGAEACPSPGFKGCPSPQVTVQMPLENAVLAPAWGKEGAKIRELLLCKQEPWELGS